MSKRDLGLSVGDGDLWLMCNGDLWLVCDSDGVWLNQVLLYWNDLFADNCGTMDWSLVNGTFALNDCVETIVVVSSVVDNATMTIRFDE